MSNQTEGGTENSERKGMPSNGQETKHREQLVRSANTFNQVHLGVLVSAPKDGGSMEVMGLLIASNLFAGVTVSRHNCASVAIL